MLPSHDSLFRFRKMDIRKDVHLAHFQLRSILGCYSRTAIFFPGARGIHRHNPVTRLTGVEIHASQFPNFGAMVSSLDANQGILMAGTFNGEYCLRNLDSPDPRSVSTGIITTSPNGITNHLQIHTSRRSTGPVAAMASNDERFRVMDIETETFLWEKSYPVPLNCTAVSPDRRLRVMVGDSCNVLITNAETGEIQQELTGHRDYGFSCDWSDDGWTVATGNQDRTIQIWDARRWCNSNGVSTPVCIIRSEMAGVRSLHFSPGGSGKRVLAAAEEADFINVIDAQTFRTKQTFDVVGEIGGIGFTNGGEELHAMCCDWVRGGLLQFERNGSRPEPYLDSLWQRGPTSYAWRNEPYDKQDEWSGYRLRRNPTMLDSKAVF